MTTTQLSDIVVSPTTRSRLAALMGFSPTESTKSPRAREDESWYIPYNGPIEPPLEEEETRGRGLSRATSNVTRKSSYTSTHGNTRSSGIGEAPVNARSSMGTRGRASTFDRGSMYSKDVDDKGRRASVGSFLTFGQRKRPAAIIAVTAEEAFNGPRRSEESHVRGRPSEDSRWNTQAQRRRSEDSAYSTTQLSHPNPQAESEWEKRKVKNARDSMEVSAGAALAGSGLLARNTSHLEPRAPTYGFGEPRRHWTYDSDADDTSFGAKITESSATAVASHLQPRAPTYGLRRNYTYDPDADDVSSEKESDETLPQEQKLAEPTTPQPALPRAVAMRHPYAVVFPTIIDDPQTPHLRPPARPTHGHSHSLSTNSNSSGSSKPHPSTVSPAAIAAALNNTPNTPRGLLRARAGTFSSPNLRALAADKQRASPRPAVVGRSSTEQRRELTKLNTQYAAETWCDAIMFPRPRFRAHVISPPSSPPDEKEEEIFMPLRRTVSARAPTTRDEPRPDYRDFMGVPKAELSRSTSNNTQRPPSPIPEVDETLRKVVAEGEQRAKEREVWNHVASSSFQNRRSRSLSRSRTRKLSGPSVARPRLGSDAGHNTESLGARLAAEVFRQPTPTISVTLSTATNSNVHSRNTSRGKVALEESNERKLEGALMSETTARLSVRGRWEEEAEADVQYVDIAPPVPRKTQPPAADRTQSQYSYASDSLEVPGMGIAISTPPPHPSPVEQDMDIPDLSSHPYASPGGPRRRAEPVPIPAAYAGPHPTSFEYPRSSREQPREQPVQAESNKKPEKEAGYAIMGPSAYAYTDGDANDKRESTLGVEEVLLSRTFQRGAARSSVFPGIAEDKAEAQAQAEAQAEAEAQMPPPPSFVPSLEPTPPATPGGSRVRRKPVPLTAAYSEIPSLSHTVTTSEHTDVTEADTEPAVPRESVSMSSPTSPGSGQPSSRLLDDLEPFRDLFYKPGRSGSDPRRTPSFEMIRATMLDETASTWSEDRIKSSEGLSGLRALARHRPSYESTAGPQEPDQDEENKQRPHSPQLEDVQEVEIPRTASPLPGLNGDTLPLGTPLRADYEQGQNFPEDIESSRASSIMEREEEDAEKTLRVGSVQLAVAETTQTERRQSTTLSIGNTEDAESSRPKRDTVATTVSSLGVPGTDDQARTSFVTTTSSTSHMSNIIGDFPAPPLGEGNTMPSAAELHAYFASSEWGGDSRVQSHISTGDGTTAPPAGAFRSFFAPSESNGDESRVQSHMPFAEGLTVPSAAALQSFFTPSESNGDESRVQSHMPVAEGVTAPSAAALQSFFAPSESNGDQSRIQSHLPAGEGLAAPSAVTSQPPSESNGDESRVQSHIPPSEGTTAPSAAALQPYFAPSESNGGDSRVPSHIPDPIPE